MKDETDQKEDRKPRKQGIEYRMRQTCQCGGLSSQESSQCRLAQKDECLLDGDLQADESIRLLDGFEHVEKGFIFYGKV